ncbi:histidine phosphatase family protein [bacterium]|nr:histidine phosphatase family protein [bacterium]
MRLFLVRHGQSETNVRWDNITENRQMNARLTETGRYQAQKLAEWMKRKIPQADALYASSLYRTRETVEPMETAYGMTAKIDHRIREGGYCYNTGAPIEDDLLPIKKNANFHADPYIPYAFSPEGVESYNDLRTRTGKFLLQLIENHLNQTVIVVTHGWTLNAFMDHVFNVGMFRNAYINAENTSITYVEYLRPYQREPWRVHFIAQTPHLEVFPDGFAYTEPEA